MSKKMIFTVGISASGKSTWAKTQQSKHVVIICRDDIRHEILTERKTRGYNPNGNPTGLWSAWKFKDENLVTERWFEQLENAVLNDDIQTIICADTNLNESRLRSLMDKITNAFGITDFGIKLFPISFEDAVKRDNARADGVGNNVIWKQYQQFLDFIKNSNYK